MRAAGLSLYLSDRTWHIQGIGVHVNIGAPSPRNPKINYIRGVVDPN